ncbi:tRNA lysidine(34) synthetase TilS [Ciceribacter azotifigens]|uniref:tRNA lysidine(34) synthetase TilS n=1 Tax=Ciceribacter azotifigens TaxID=2069303 RepID=UPI003A85CFAA
MDAPADILPERDTSPEDAVSQFLGSLAKPSRILVAISGGSDSTGLLLALHRRIAAGDQPHTLFAATIDHALRPDSALEAARVAAFCRDLGIPHETRRWLGEKPTTGISVAAREARYRLLADIAAEFRADLLVTGHTADDQAETVAMRTARAPSPHGLAGMAPATLYDRRLWIVRPFLSARRAAIRAFLTRNGLGWIDDPSNVNPAYERVRTRMALSQAIPDAGRTAATRRTRLSGEAANLLRSTATVRHGTIVRLAPEAFDAEPEVLRHALAFLLAVLGGRSYLPASEQMDRVTALALAPGHGRATAARTLCWKRADGFYLMREDRNLPQFTVAPGRTALWDDRFLVTNGGEDEIRVGPGPELPAGEDDRSAPRLLARHRARVLPHVISPEGGAPLAAAKMETLSVEPVLAPFDHFLPVFDLAVADVLATLFGRFPYPVAPI